MTVGYVKDFKFHQPTNPKPAGAGKPQKGHIVKAAGGGPVKLPPKLGKSC